MKKLSHCAIAITAFALIQVIVPGAESFLAFGQNYDTALIESDRVYEETRPLNIDGVPQKVDPLTRRREARQRQRAIRNQLRAEKLEEQRLKTDDQVLDTVDQKREESERKIFEKLQEGLTGKKNTSQSAPAPQVVQKVSTVAPISIQTRQLRQLGQQKNKLIPSLGISNISGDGIDFESKYRLGLSVESLVTPYLSVGLKFSLSSLGLSAVRYAGNNSYQYQRELKYNHLSLGIFSKFYMLQQRRIRPYLSTGLNFNRAGLRYDDNDSNYQNRNQNRNRYRDRYREDSDKFYSSYVSGGLGLGTDFIISDNFGVNIDLSYSKNFSNPKYVFNSSSNDQERLEAIGKSIEDSNIIALNLGLIWAF